MYSASTNAVQSLLSLPITSNIHQSMECLRWQGIVCSASDPWRILPKSKEAVLTQLVGRTARHASGRAFPGKSMQKQGKGAT